MQQPDILKAVAREFEVTEDELMSKARPDHIAFPRQVAMTLFYQISPLHSSKAVGRMFGKNHGTVLHAIKARCCPLRNRAANPCQG